MKFIEGETLTERIGRESPGDLLRIFSSVCQAMAFAHRKHVIHRDLKPDNIMIGHLGEVQIMDWGLAKSLADSQTESALAADIVTTPARHSEDQTMDRGAMGTFAYMPPEQFESPVKATAASDVFALGAVLCQILTGRAPFAERTTLNQSGHVTGGRRDQLLSAAIEELRSGDLDSELVDLAVLCLQPDPADRPASASVVSQRMTDYLANLETQLQEERLERERDSVRLIEHQKRSRLRLGFLLALVAVLGLLAAGGFLWQQRQAEFRQIRALADSELKQVESAFERSDYRTAQRLLPIVEVRLRTAETDALRNRFDKMSRAITLVNRLQVIQDERTTPTPDGLFDNESAMRNYVAAFRPLGIDMIHDQVETIADKLSSAGVADAVLRPIDNWALVCNYRMIFDPENRAAHQALRDRLLQLAISISDDTAGNEIRNPAVWDNAEQLKTTAEQAIVASNLSAELAGVLSELLRLSGADPAGFLHHYQRLYRADFWLSFNLARWYHDRDLQQSLIYGNAALAIRPGNAIVMANLGTAHICAEKFAEARPYYDATLKLYPDFIPALSERELTWIEEDPERALRNIEALVKKYDSNHARAVLREAQEYLASPPDARDISEP